jgi:hypothetical protein
VVAAHAASAVVLLAAFFPHHAAGHPRTEETATRVVLELAPSFGVIHSARTANVNARREQLIPISAFDAACICHRWRHR